MQIWRAVHDSDLRILTELRVLPHFPGWDRIQLRFFFLHTVQSIYWHTTGISRVVLPKTMAALNVSLDR